MYMAYTEYQWQYARPATLAFVVVVLLGYGWVRISSALLVACSHIRHELDMPCLSLKLPAVRHRARLATFPPNMPPNVGPVKHETRQGIDPG